MSERSESASPELGEHSQHLERREEEAAEAEQPVIIEQVESDEEDNHSVELGVMDEEMDEEEPIGDIVVEAYVVEEPEEEGGEDVEDIMTQEDFEEVQSTQVGDEVEDIMTEVGDEEEQEVEEEVDVTEKNEEEGEEDKEEEQKEEEQKEEEEKSASPVEKDDLMEGVMNEVFKENKVSRRKGSSLLGSDLKRKKASKAQRDEFSDQDDELEALARRADPIEEIEIDEVSFPAYLERPRLCKYLTLFGECGEEKCVCAGFRLPYISRREMFKVDNEVGSLPQSAICFACGHKLCAHFTGIRNLTIEDVDRLSDIIDDIDVAHDAIKDAHPYIASHMFNFYKHCLMALRLLNPDAITDPFRAGDALPPFERPSVEVLMRHYLGLNTPTDKSLSRPMYIYAARFLSEFNKWRPPLPEYFHLCHVDETVYTDFLDKWTVYCALPEIFPSLTQHEPVLVFGINAIFMYSRFLKRTSKDTEEDPRRRDLIVNDPMSSLEMRHFCRGFFRYLYDARKRNQDKLRYIKPHLHAGFQWPIWDKLVDLKDGGIGPETRQILRSVHKEMKLSDKERESGYIPHDTMMRTCVKMVENEREKGKDNTTKDMFLVEVSRGDVARNEEREGIIRFVNIKHDVDEMTPRENIVWLLQLQTLFSIQLPKMPKEYITRLVFDDRHRNLALVKRDKGVIGGICYRPFKEQGFCEIVFCAITANEQVKGYGTHLMNHIKEFMATRYDIPHLLTFADEYATGYFTKQGFTESLGMSKDKYTGFIKEYEGATLMGCTLNDEFNYTNFSGYARVARDMHAALYDVLFPETRAIKTYGGIEHLFVEHEKHSADPLPLQSIPGMRDFDTKYNQPKVNADLDNKMKNIMIKLKADANAWPFEEPVNLEEVPEYGEYITFPIDLSTISTRIREKYYIHERLFIGDLNRLFDNCYKFNGVETIYYFCGYKLNQLAKKLVKKEFSKSDLQIHDPEWEPTYSE